MVHYDQKDILVTMINEASFRTTASGADTAIAAGVTTYGLPIVLQSADIDIPIKTREEIHGIGSGKYPSKIVNKSYEPVDVTLEGPMLLGTFLSYAVGQSYTSTAAQAEVIYIDCLPLADISAAAYFQLLDGTDNHYLWMDTTNGDSDPSGTGTGIECVIDGATTASDVAEIVKDAITGDASFTATHASGTSRVVVTCAQTAATTDPWDNDTGFRIFVVEQGTATTTTSYAHRFSENVDYQLDSFTLHVETLATSQNILYDLTGCVVDSLEIEMSMEGGFITCRANIKAAGIALTNGPGVAQTTKPSELAIEPFVWGDLDNSGTTGYRFIDENATERGPTSIESIKLTISNNAVGVPGIGDAMMNKFRSGKREIELNFIGFIENKDLWDYWRGTFDNANKRMNSASTGMSALLRIIRTAGTDILTIYLYNLFINEHDSHLQTIDETIKAVNITLRAAQSDADKRQIYANEITGPTYSKVYFGNTDET